MILGIIIVAGIIALLYLIGKKKEPTVPTLPVEPEFPLPEEPGDSILSLAFGFSEIVEDHLPEYIIGWATATCRGMYNYVPPAGYVRTSCETTPGLGSHGGCPGCIMSLVRCDKI